MPDVSLTAGLAQPGPLQRKAQFLMGLVEAENSTVHAPQEAAGLLGDATDYARQGQVALRN